MVLHVSDTHFRSTLKAMPRFFERKLARLTPDLVVGTGDFLGDTRSAQQCAEMLSAVPARLGRVFVLGSNDYYAPVPKNPLRYFGPTRRPYRHGAKNETWTDLVSALEARGWQFLRNDRTRLDGIEISGLDDPHIGRADLTAAPPRNAVGFRLAVVHSPQVARKLAENGFDLILSGHTHGGQIRVPGYGALVTNTPGLPRRMARGAHRLGGAWLHVTAGLGTSKFTPIRFACRPEACLLELVPRA
ncbi:MAG TPA: metallophosphoesterase, partial [Actinomycetota bacterium]|nr:metallophosphoesterase [Actinomycetota bacterium]